MFGRLFGFKARSRKEISSSFSAAPLIPKGERVYAVGDIHGRLDLLRRCHEHIQADLQKNPIDHAKVIYLGDYVDRGPASNQVLSELIERPIEGVESVYLRGNHEHFMLLFLEDPLHARMWLDYGGLAALISYNVQVPAIQKADERLLALRDGLKRNIPASHIEFLGRLQLTYEVGDYLFVHAGVHPLRPFAQQIVTDLISIRSPFIEWNKPLAKMIVHGHTISEEPEFKPHRIGIDTGAFATGRLTCLVLEGQDKRILG